ncbi:odorant receptor 56a-like isoform X2 [Lycorma delicatula]|uniref:odorant receptor 56a-like isoform X2 n=1 Tax=Lycorma delicatula TaxID=130591 RepID=UPI003F514BD2
MDSPGVSGVESEFLYRELMWFSWINKSKSYKNNLKFMMLCAKKPMEIRPVFYVLNLNNVVKIAHGTFSYFSVMRSLKMTKH